MIPNQWYVVLESKQIKNKPIGVTRMGEKLVFWRDQGGKVSCLRDMCVHRGVQLSTGKIIDGHLQCPFHGFEYDSNGRVVVIPANGKDQPVPKTFQAHRYPTYEAHGWIWIWWGDPPEHDPAPPQYFDDLGDGFSYGTAIDPWKAHYSRVIENQLDVVHLPFVHYNTIGRGNKTVVDGPVLEWLNESQFRFFVYNRADDGRPARKPSEMPPPNPETDFYLGFIFPNLWQNYISEDVRLVAAFVPVDNETTLLYLHFYQRFMRLPLLRGLVNRLSMPANLFIAGQDKRVVETHQIKPSGLKIGEKLIPGDLPIVEYRRRREELLQQNQPKA